MRYAGLLRKSMGIGALRPSWRIMARRGLEILTGRKSQIGLIIFMRDFAQKFMINSFFRFEFKYPISEHNMMPIEEDLRNAGMTPDCHTPGEDSYTVSSLYFDTVDFSDYYDKLGGFRDRKKIRARIYDEFLSVNTSGVWLEVKEKADMVVFKKRICVDVDEWNNFLGSGFNVSKLISVGGSDESSDLLKKIGYDIHSRGRRPHVLIAYRRKPYAYTWNINRFRVTLDSNIRSCRASNFPEATPLFSRIKIPQDAVMEIKYNNFIPPFMGHIIKKYNLNRDAYSKYALGFEATRRFNPIKK